jgi:hypothetical protein
MKDMSSANERRPLPNTTGLEPVSEASWSGGSARSDEAPAVGVVATGSNDDAVARVVLRALSRGLDVYLTFPPNADPAVVEWIDHGAVTVVPPTDLDDSEGGVTARLVGAARGRSEPGLVLVEDAERPVSFDASVDRWSASDGYAMAAALDSTRAVDTMVAIPAYNEAATIADVVSAAREHADTVLVVDDGSTDGTANRAEAAGATVVTHGTNRGYGTALQTAFREAAARGASRLVTVDGDGQHDLDDVPELADAVEDDGANVAIGSRMLGDATAEMPTYRRVGFRVVNLLMNLSLDGRATDDWLTDTQSGFRAYDRPAIEGVDGAGDVGADMEASLDILFRLREAGLHVAERPTTVDYDVDSASTRHPLPHGLQLVSTILWTVERQHPILFLGVPGVVLALVGGIFGYATAVSYLTGGSPSTATALASVSALLLGTITCFTAIMLHSIQAQLAAVR